MARVYQVNPYPILYQHTIESFSKLRAANIGSKDGACDKATFHQPSAIVVDHHGYLIVSDWYSFTNTLKYSHFPLDMLRESDDVCCGCYSGTYGGAIRKISMLSGAPMAQLTPTARDWK